MKLVIYDPEEKPKEFEVTNLNEAEKQCEHAHHGDSAYVLFNEDGTVLHSGQCCTMSADAWDEPKEQVYYCEACKHEGLVHYIEHAGVFDVIEAINTDHLFSNRTCSLGFGATRIRVRSEGCTDAEWAEVTRGAITRFRFR